jgi:hypothetical protein
MMSGGQPAQTVGTDPTAGGRRDATVELLGVLAYGQLRAFAAMSSAVRFAPDARSADRIASFARREHEAYEALRGHLASLTDRPTVAMDRQKAVFDRYFARAPLDDWFGACVFFAFGVPLARDFMRSIVPLLDEVSSDVVRRAFEDREEIEQAAVALLRSQLGSEVARERARRVVADLLGDALAAFQQASSDSDALAVLLRAGEGDDDRAREVRGLAMGLLTAHRARSVVLGLEDAEGLSEPGLDDEG